MWGRGWWSGAWWGSWWGVTSAPPVPDLGHDGPYLYVNKTHRFEFKRMEEGCVDG